MTTYVKLYFNSLYRCLDASGVPTTYILFQSSCNVYYAFRALRCAVGSFKFTPSLYSIPDSVGSSRSVSELKAFLTLYTLSAPASALS